jgi:type VI secretion system protein ImpC
VIKIKTSPCLHQYNIHREIRGATGGFVDNLPKLKFKLPDYYASISENIFSTELPYLPIQNRLEKKLIEQGLTLLVNNDEEYNCTVFNKIVSLQQPIDSGDLEVKNNAIWATHLEVLLPFYRFIHYLKCIIRDNNLAVMEREKIQAILNKWISQYVEPKPLHINKTPLAEATIILTDHPHGFGYKAQLSIIPQYQTKVIKKTVKLEFFILA